MNEEKIKQKKSFYLVSIACLLLLWTIAFNRATFADELNPCSADIEKFCKDATQGRPLLKCLEQHESQLSNACKEFEKGLEGARVESREAKLQQMRLRFACREDVIKFCNDTNLGSDGILPCLKEHASDLSASCREVIKSVRKGEEEKMTH
jgi:hypothetical protein